MRTARRVLGILLRGAALVILSAWVFAAVASVSGGHLHRLNGPDDTNGHERGYLRHVPVPSDWTVRSWHECWGVGMRYDMVTEMVWMGSLPGASESTAPNRVVTAVTLGWPMPALRVMEWYPAVPGRPWLEAGLPIWTGTRGVSTSRPWPLPVMPVWPAFAVDLLVWAALAEAARRGVIAWRRARRRRRGLCVGCGYDLRGRAGDLHCPECGDHGDPPRVRMMAPHP